jgi:hypothetical protein
MRSQTSATCNPLVLLKWNRGVHTFMTCVTGGVPIGIYEASRLSNIGIGHGGRSSHLLTRGSPQT